MFLEIGLFLRGIPLNMKLIHTYNVHILWARVKRLLCRADKRARRNHGYREVKRGESCTA
jgi:hypothetical protein